MNYYDYQTTVNYSDLGEDGGLSQTGALRIMQEAACFASAAVGCAPGQLQEDFGVGWILVGWKLRMDAHPAWGTPITVRTWPRRMDVHFSDRDFLILDGAGNTILAATSGGCCWISAPAGPPLSPPPWPSAMPSGTTRPSRGRSPPTGEARRARRRPLPTPPWAGPGHLPPRQQPPLPGAGPGGPAPRGGGRGPAQRGDPLQAADPEGGHGPLPLLLHRRETPGGAEGQLPQKDPRPAVVLCVKLHASGPRCENRQKPGRLKVSRVWAVPVHTP